MTLRSHPATGLAFILLVFLGMDNRCCAQLRPDSPSKLRQLLQEMASETPDPCDAPSVMHDVADRESSVFRDVEENVTEALNASSENRTTAGIVAEQALEKLERQSAEINASWPDENRLHYKLLDLPPILVLKLTFRTHARFVVFAIPPGSSKTPNRLWQQVGSDDVSFEHESPRSWLDLHPLHRGPSGNARFLASFGYTGCAGSLGVVYDVREWAPKDGTGYIEQIIKQEGAFGMDQAPQGHSPTAKDPFPAIGVLRTTDKLLTLPYCWFSAIDTWDNPSLCAVDTYELSGDTVAFRSRTYNRPDLVPVAKAIEFADRHDYPAVRAYCASDELAHRLVRNLPPHAEDLQVTRIGAGEETVEMGSALFRVERRNGRWLVVAFKSE